MATDPLREATRAYVEAAFALIRTRCSPQADEEMGLYRWDRADGQIFRLVPRTQHWWVPCLQVLRDEIHELPERTALLDQIQADRELAVLIDAHVGYLAGSRLVDVDQLTDRMIWRLGEACGSDELSMERFDVEYEVADAELRQTDVEQGALVPILGLSTSAQAIPVGDGAVIDQLSDEEASRLLGVGLMPSAGGMPFAFGLASGIPTHGYRLVRRYDRVVGEMPEGASEEFADAWNEGYQSAEDVLIALRIFKAGRVGMPGIATFTTAWAGVGATTFAPLPDFQLPARPSAYEYALADEEAAQLPDFVARYRKAKGLRILDLAMRRFAYAADRSRADDRIVDLMIAAEALLLPDTMTELSYQLALRGAWILEVEEPRRRAVFQFLKNAYDARSTIVHGSGTPKPKKMRSLDGSKLLGIDAFAAEIETTLRSAIRAAVDAVDRTGTFPSTSDDWHQLIVGPLAAITDESEE